MTKYIFIGTEQDLIDNGYLFCEDMSEYGHYERTTQNGYSYIDGKTLEIFYVDDVQKIQDLIDKGLVMEVKQ